MFQATNQSKVFGQNIFEIKLTRDKDNTVLIPNYIQEDIKAYII